ncbi:MAG TPA: CPBP family intramembrane metalloprotease [Terrimesophilobacter sp.]|nr:CPBP family intramembrane metalloprotease [Terrimesophilobacter sp.]HRP99772.1 CPBP family intramembrane metalloprotease [Terrimesophilobacter sp.]
MPVTDSDPVVRDARSPGLIPAVLLVASAVPLFAFRMHVVGYPMMVAALLIAWWIDRRSRAEGERAELFRDLLLIAIGMTIVSTVSVAADISWGNFFLLGFVLAAAVAVPYGLSRWVFRDHRIRFPWNFRQRWTRAQWVYLIVVIAAGYLILPFYFVSSGVYLNWPAVHEWHEIGRLFVGVNAVGTWDELFFICTVFVLLRRHFPPWQANLLQTVVFVSFLWELGYQSWGPLLTIPFALVQGFTFNLTKSLTYVLVVHLLFDAIVFLVIVGARNPGWLPIFVF